MFRSKTASLGDDIVSLATHIHAATQRLLEMIRQFDHERGWETEGRSSCADWLGHKTGMAMSTAHEHVRVARRLGELPAIDDAFGKGKLSYCKVRAVTRVADAHNEDKLVEVAVTKTGQELEQVCRGIRDANVATGQRQAERNVRQRSMGDGTVVVSMRLRADEAELVMKAIAEARREIASDSSAEESAADAAVHVAESFLAGAPSSDAAAKSTRSNRRADRTQLLVHLQEDSARLHDSGHWLSREAFERLSCDCAVTPAKTGADGKVLDVGRSRRTVPPAIGRALLVQDEGCTFPGCSNRRFVDAHHIEHWSRGGETSLQNLCLLCHHHHTLVHEGDFTVERTEEGLRFVAPDGQPVPNHPTPTGVTHDPLTLLALLNLDIAAPTHIDAPTS